MGHILWASQPQFERNPLSGWQPLLGHIKSPDMKLTMAIKSQHKMPNKSANVIMQNKHFNMFEGQGLKGGSMRGGSLWN